MRQRQASGASASIIAAYAAALSLTTPSLAKTPGEVHCYNGICHRVKTVEEMQLIVGNESEALTSYYDSAENDSMNVGTITSSGEEFDADSDSHAASSLYPDGTELLVWNPKNRHAAHIRVNDFGPFYMMRTIDVTRGVAEKLEFNHSGVAKLRVIVIWAPNPEAARFRRHRVYPAVEGYLGRLDLDQLYALKQRLIETGPDRNGVAPLIVAAAVPKLSLKFLPAFAHGIPGNDAARAKAIILNAPRFTLNANGPALVITDKRPRQPLAASASPVRSLGSAQAMAAASQSAEAIVTARDADLSIAVASLEVISGAAVAQPAAAYANAGSASPRAAAHAAPALRAWAPNTLMWQQLLAALGLMSIAGVGWRTRQPSRNGQMRTQALATHSQAPQSSARGLAQPLFPAYPGPAELAIDETPPPAPFEPIDNIIALPQLPRRPSAKSMDEWRDEAVGHMEAYAFALAEAAYRQLVAAREAAFGATDPMTASAERQLADCLREQGRYAAAEPHYRRAVSTMTLAAGDVHPATADVLDEYAVSLLKQGRGAEAERTARQSLTIRRANGASSREYAVTLSIVAETLRAQGQLPAAEAEHRRAWSQFIAVSGQDSLDAAASITSIGTVLGELGRFAPAEELLNAGTRIISSICGQDHPVSAMGYALLGDLYLHAGALDAAGDMQRYALQIRERTIGERHPDTIENVLTLSLIAAQQYRLDDARLLLDRALDCLITGERNHFGPQSRIRRLLVALSHHLDTSTPQAIAAQ